MLRLLLLLAVLVAAGMTSCSTDKEVGRTAIPHTNLILVLNEDEKQMFRYQVFADKELVLDNNFLGPHDYGVSTLPIVSVNGSTVRLTWRGSYITQFVEFNVATCEIINDSHETGRRQVPHCHAGT